MKAINSKLVSVVIFAGLAALTLFSFQNCSPSIAALGFGKPAHANDITDMLNNSRSELDSTVHQFKAKSRDINSVPEEKGVGVYGEVKDPEEIKKQIAAKLEQKKVKSKSTSF